ncbi:MAG: hypothetical protein HC897_05730, partial [Thermoanaerobaculia bacterium]|nr:hypothetical protein [Thermoanaerobaculia bacterium]
GGLLRVRLELPGGLADAQGRLVLDLLSLGAGGLEIAGAGADQPPTALEGEQALVLHRQSDEPWQEGYNLFISDPVVLLADLRASAKITRTSKENEACKRCDLIEQGVYPDATAQTTSPVKEMLSGHSLGVRFTAEQRAALVAVYGDFLLDEAEIEVPSVRWARSPAVRQEPTLNPSQGIGDAAPGTLLHSGEMTLTATDFALRGRRFDVAFTRTYRNQTVGAGPLGPGWDHVYNQSLRELGNGDVDFADGRGRSELFQRQQDGTYEAPPGRFVSLEKIATGWMMIEPGGERRRFNTAGQLTETADALRTSETTGNALRFTYNAKDELVEIRDDLDRAITLEYDNDHLSKIRDFSGREFTYGYDTAGRLITVETPPVKTIESPLTAEPLITRYAYAIPAGSDTEKLHQRDDLISITDAKNQTWLELTYTDIDSDGRAQEVTSQRWGAGTVQLAYDFAQGRTTVTDRRGNLCRYDHNSAGQVTRIEDPAQAVWTFSHDDEGLITEQTEPLGRRTEIVFETQGNRRSRGNVREVRVTADSRGPNGSAPVLVTSTEYEEVTNKPTRIVDPRGAVTTIERNEAGLPLTITRAAGAAEASTTRTTYNDHGQPVEITNPNGNKRRYDYFTSGASKGYPQKVTIDPGGLAITTRWETDARGNVTATIGPRGVRDEHDFNALDWPIADRRAVTGSSDGAPALSYQTKRTFDRNGNLAEQQIPFDDGTQSTSVRHEYGQLDESLSTRRQVNPGDAESAWVGESLEYDANLNVTRTTDPEGNVREITYDERNLPTEYRSGLGAHALPVSIVETTVYDLEQRPTMRTDGRGNAWTTIYDGYGRVQETRDPLGNRQGRRYDSSGNVVAYLSKDAVGTLLSESEDSYDLLNRSTATTEWLWGYDPLLQGSGDRPGNARAITQTRTWDAASNLITSRDALGRVMTQRYDRAERMVETEDPLGNRQQLELDVAGNAVVQRSIERDPQGAEATVSWTTAYDALGRPAAESDAFGNTTQLFHDARGLLRSRIDAESFQTSWVFDGLNRKTTEIQPEGIRIDLGYDKSSRLMSYRDALGNTTSWSYDAIDRKTRTCYPDSFCEIMAYDATSNPISKVDQRGTTIATTFDAANRLSSRTITPASGQTLRGPLVESYTYDGLDRLTSAQSGAVMSERGYDSLSRVVRDMSHGHTVSYQLDDAGNITNLTYPSAQTIERTIDALDRPSTIRKGGAADTVATFGYRGSGVVQEKTLGPDLTSTTTFDAARRPILESVTGASGLPTFQERLAWTPRNLKLAQSRSDLNGLGHAFGYDGAQRLTVSATTADAVASLPNNTSPNPASLATSPDAESFSYDAAQNLLSRAQASYGIASEQELPRDSSGRNRPASVNGVALQWDANGNLIEKGDLRFEYDYRNRLSRVSNDQGTEMASYTYDAFNRRVEQTAGGVVTQTAWDGWRPVEDYRGGQLASRRIYGLGIDEVVRMETDLDGDGTLDQSLIPLFDSTGNLVLVADEQGKPLERYSYTAYGGRRIYADLTPPVIEQIRVKSGEIWLEISEEVLATELQKALAAGQLRLVETGTSEPLEVSVEQPIQSGRQARRRVVIRPAEIPAEATELRLVIEPPALVDPFHNRLAATFELTFAWPTGDVLLQDTAAPRVEMVRLRSGVLEIELSEEADLLSAAAAILIDGTATTWMLAPEGYTLVGESAIPLGSHTLAIGGGPLDLDGKGLFAPLTLGVVRQSTVPDAIVYVAPDPTEINESAVGNRFAFHGLSNDEETGFVYMRNRYFDPQLGGFISVDPLGYVDHPGLYTFAMNSPTSYSDPLGLQAESGTIKVKPYLRPIYVRVEPIKSSVVWSQREIELQLQVANRIFGEQAGVHVFWTGIREDPNPKEALTDQDATDLLKGAALGFSAGTGGYEGLPIVYLRETSDNPEEGGSALPFAGPTDLRRSVIVNRYWRGKLTNQYVTAHELGHAIGGLCDPYDFSSGCRFGAPQPERGGVMNYPSPYDLAAQGEGLSEGEIKRMRKNAQALATHPGGPLP